MADQKIIISIGGTVSVGKTSLLSQFINHDFNPIQQTTIGTDFILREVETPSGEIIQVRFNDTAGQERFASLVKTYFRSADGVILVYSITDQESFDRLPAFIEMIPEGIPVTILGNKYDLSDDRVVTKQALEDFAQPKGYLYEEVSALTQYNLEQAFMDIIEKTAKYVSEKPKPISTPIPSNQEKKNCC